MTAVTVGGGWHAGLRHIIGGEAGGADATWHRGHEAFFPTVPSSLLSPPSMSASSFARPPMQASRAAMLPTAFAAQQGPVQGGGAITSEVAQLQRHDSSISSTHNGGGSGPAPSDGAVAGVHHAGAGVHGQEADADNFLFGGAPPDLGELSAADLQHLTPDQMQELRQLSNYIDSLSDPTDAADVAEADNRAEVVSAVQDALPKVPGQIPTTISSEDHHDAKAGVDDLRMSQAGFDVDLSALHTMKTAVLVTGGMFSKVFGLGIVGYLAFQSMQANVARRKEQHGEDVDERPDILPTPVGAPSQLGQVYYYQPPPPAADDASVRQSV